MSTDEPTAGLAGAAGKRGGLLRQLLILAMVLVVGLVLTLALNSPFDAHPDEIGYVPCSEYYSNHWLPPEIGAPDARSSYQYPYGSSRLYSQYFVWLLSGKFLNLVEPLSSLRSFVNLRLFSVFLLALLVALGSFGRGHTWLVCVILLSPQLWYVFAYMNNDSLPLLLSFALAVQVAIPGSLFDRFLRDPRLLGSLAGALLVSLMLGVLSVEKNNFLLFILFLGFYLAWKLARQSEARPFPFMKLALVAMVAVSIGGGKLLMDRAIYGPDKRASVLAYREKMAAPEYRLSNADKPNSYYWAYLKAKNVPYTYLFTKADWHGKTFRSFNGVYGYMDILASEAYYGWVFILQCALFGWLAVKGLTRGGPRIRILLAATFATTVAIVALSSYFSWTLGFQAQGRYLFPILPVWAITAFEIRSLIDRVAIGLFGLLVASSIYSFVFIALPMLAPSP